MNLLLYVWYNPNEKTCRNFEIQGKLIYKHVSVVCWESLAWIPGSVPIDAEKQCGKSGLCCGVVAQCYNEYRPCFFGVHCSSVQLHSYEFSSGQLHSVEFS